MTETITMREAQARTLIALVVEHRERCDEEDCTTTLALMLPLYEYILNRDASETERRCFL